MDYSAINQGGFEDPEHNPHATSPDSSRYDTPSFGGLPGSESPFAHGIGNETPVLHDHHGFHNQDDNDNDHEHDPHMGPPSPQVPYDQQQQEGQEGGAGGIQQQPQQHLHPGPNYRPQPQQRTSSKNIRAQQQQQKPLVQYKLLAKITGLERTGRKDPILRFDVHVSNLLLPQNGKAFYTGGIK